MNATRLEADIDAVTHQKIVFCLDTATKLDGDTFRSLATNKGDKNASDLFIIDIARCLLAGDVNELRQLLNRSTFVKQPYLVLLKRACQYLCAERANDVIKTVVELEASNISNPLCYVLAAEAQFMTHQYTEAFHNFSTANNQFIFNDYLTTKIRHCLPHIEATRFSLPLESGAIGYLKDVRFDSAAIAPLVSSLIKHKYQLNAENTVVVIDDARFEEVKQDAFFLEALQRLLLPDPDIELFLIQIRKALLHTFTKNSKLSASNSRLLGGLSLQAYLNEHVHYVTDSESEVINATQELVKRLLSQPKAPTEQLANLLLIISLYEPLSEQAYYSQLLAYSKDEWPSEVQDCLERILYHPKKELECIDAIPCLTSINDKISLLVGEQYETNPYPRWHEVHQIENNEGYAKYNGINKPPFLKAKHFDKPLKMLVAGCGTGKHPIALALKFPSMQITAIDLSRRSLAYAKMMAKQYNVSNISFHQADILELSALEERFNVIESMGVLHHMKDPTAGLQILKGLLVKQGVIKLGLYSEIARKEIANFRAENLLEGTRDNIRRMRSSVITENRAPYEDCLKSSDFYSTSMCRDLLFHAQEHTFSLSSLESILKKNKLSFKGFTFSSQETFMKFRTSYPSASKSLDLQAWHQFEKKNPLTFAGMYQFFTQSY